MEYCSQQVPTAHGINIQWPRNGNVAIGGGSPKAILCLIDEEMLCKCSDKCSKLLIRLFSPN